MGKLSRRRAIEVENGYLLLDLALEPRRCLVFHLPANSTEFSGFLFKRLVPSLWTLNPSFSLARGHTNVSPDSFGGEDQEPQGSLGWVLGLWRVKCVAFGEFQPLYPKMSLLLWHAQLALAVLFSP